MPREQRLGLIISNFTVEPFTRYLHNDDSPPDVRTTVAPFNQVLRVLADTSLPCWEGSPDFTVVWTQPESVIESFGRLTSFTAGSMEAVLAEVDAFSDLVLGTSRQVKSVFVPTWIFPPYHRGLGMLDMRTGRGVSNALLRMNLRLIENLEKAANVYVLDTQRWASLSGKTAFNPKLWYMGKIAFGNDVFLEAARDIKAALNGIDGNARKLVVLDLDDTLWGGILGDVGQESLVLGGHDHIGEAFVDFQRALKALKNRGVLLGIISRNDEANALDALNRHPEMILRPDDFAGWRINWDDKAKNMVDLVTELNLGLQSVVFIDDDPAQRARIAEAFPEVLVPAWPSDPTTYRSTLVSLRCFDSPAISEEDAARTEMYSSERERQALRLAVASPDEWLKGLAVKVTIEELAQTNLARAAQLFNKTNQMNLATRRLTDAELARWAGASEHRMWVVRVVDRFGDSGLTGIVSLEIDGQSGRIVDFILSCRVMGRNVEEAMLHKVLSFAKNEGLAEVTATYVPTPKNKPCLDFFKRSGLASHDSPPIFQWSATDTYVAPPFVNIEDRSR